MLVLTRKKHNRTNLYLRTPHGPKLLGSIVVVNEREGRIGFDFARDEVLVLRDEADPYKPREDAA